MKWNRKQVICLLSILLVATIAVGGIAMWLRQEKLEQLQNEALAELERNAGQYDEQSIVLYETSKAKAEELAKLYGAKLRITENGRFATLTLPAGTTIRDIYALAESRKYIDEMAADYRVSVSKTTEEERDGERLPQRPQYSVSDTDYQLQTYLDYLNMGAVWNSYTGSGVTVAVIDTGIDTDHPEFAGRISEYSYNATEDKIVKDYNDWSLIEDEQGHGTGVTGVIAATMNSGNVVGIAPDVEIIVIKAECDEDGNFYRTSDLLFGIYYAIERDVDVVNMSFGAYAVANPFEAAIQLAYDSDIICVAAAGNERTSSLCWPAADEHVIGVGALDGWSLSYYSNYGENTDVMAPGTTYTTRMGGSYGVETGTSLASPIVAGAMALLLQNNPYMTFDDVTQILYASCYDLGDPGRDWYYGFGALDISALLLEERGKITYDMLTDELDNLEGLFIQGHALQELPEPERLYAVFDGWYYDDTFTEEYKYYADKFYGDEITLYAKWVNENDGIPYTYVVLDDGTVEIRSYTGHRRFITIPEMIDGCVVSSIGDYAFANQSRLREVTLPSGLRHIGLAAFQNCANLISIQIPENVTEMEANAFSNNVRLSTVAFQGNSKLKTIGTFAFESCGKLERIELPASLEHIDGSAFYGATALHSIGVQRGNTALQSKEGVLYNLSGSMLVAFPAAWGTSYTMPETAIYIGNYAFALAKIKTIDLANVTDIQEAAFAGSMLETITISDNVVTMEMGAFRQCEHLESVELGRGLKTVSESAFKGCASLQNITIPNGILTIDSGAFANSGLKTVIFEKNSSLRMIGSSAFYNCHISQIDIPDSVLGIGNEAFSGWMIGNPLIRVGFGENSRLHTIGESAFANCVMLDTIRFPESLRTIAAFAFQNSGLTTVTIPAGVTELGDGAFSLCCELTEVKVAKGNGLYYDMDGVVYTLDNTTIHTYPAGKAGESYALQSTTQIVAPWAFAGSVNLSTAQLPEGLIQISEYAFAYCDDLQYMNIPDEVMQISSYAFANDWNLRTVAFNESSKLPRLSYGAFAYSGITGFRVPANVSTMAQGVFEGCRNLVEITFAANSKLESIAAYMFNGCGNLQTIVFEHGSTLTSIQAHGLEGMDKLQRIDFGDAKLTNIDNFAFRFCESLYELNLPETLTNIGRYAFYGCKSLSRLVIPSHVEHIGSYAFLGANDMELYFVSETLPLYLDENWDHDTKGYYTGVNDVKENGDYRYAVLHSGNIAILEYLGSDTSVDLTKVQLGGNITIIGGSAFEGSSVQSIVLPNSLTAIQAEAFAYSALKNITIPADVTFIGREAFAYTDIESLTFSKNAKITVIEQYAFAGTKKLTAVSLPESLTTMGSGVFMGSGLQQVAFAKKIALEEISQKAFAETKLTAVTLPDSVTLVNHNAFNNVQTLRSVTFGQKENIRLMSNAFYRTGLTSLHIPENVTYIGEYCFVALGNLTEFTVDKKNPNYMAEDGLLLSKDGRKLIAVPAGRTGSLMVPLRVEEIGFGAFEESKLTEVLFHEDTNILTFGYRAFFKANNITTITIPKSVVSIDYYAFAYCENLREVIFAEGNQLKGIYEGAFCGDINLETITLPDSIVELSDFAFYGCSKITKLPISESNQIKGIYDYAFAYAGIGGELTTPESLIDIGNYAFLGTKLTKVTIPDTNKKDLIIGIGAFEGCDQLTEITLPFIGAGYEDEKISWFGYIFGAGAYQANETYVPKSLKTVTITDGVSMVGVGGFAYCTGLETINIPHSVSMVWGMSFYETTARYELTQKITCRGGYAFGKGVSGRLEIDEGITEIYQGAFEKCTYLTEIVLPEGVTSIGVLAFSECSNLVNVVMPDSVTTIEGHAFQYCEKLKTIVLPKELTEIPMYLFWHCESLTQIVIPDRVEIIREGAFYSCYRLGCVTLGEAVAEIEGFAFADCDALSKVYNNSSLELRINGDDYGGVAQNADVLIDKNGNVSYRESDGTVYLDTDDGFRFVVEDEQYILVSYIGEDDTVTLPDHINGTGYRIGGFEGAKKVIIPYGFTEVNESAFYGSKLLQSVVIPDSVQSIQSGAFAGCENLKDVVIPDSVTHIHGFAFNGCTELEKIDMPDHVTFIGMNAFGYCESLAEIYIPSSVIEIEHNAFDACSTLRGITVDANNPVYASKDGVLYTKDLSKILAVPDGIGGCVIIPEGTPMIEDYMFYGCKYLEEVHIPDSVTQIGEYTFSFCDSLTTIEVPDSVTDIGEGAFAYSGSLETVTLGSGITKISKKMFNSCGELRRVVMSDRITEFGDESFSSCYRLYYLELPSSLERIGDYAFFNSSLTSITIPENVRNIGREAFGWCQGLEVVFNKSDLSFVFGSEEHGMVLHRANVLVDKYGNISCNQNNPDTTYYVTEDAFCFKMIEGEQPILIAYLGEEERVTLPLYDNGVPYIIDYVVGGKEIIIPNGFESVNGGAFCFYSQLTDISIPESVKYIGTEAFTFTSIMKEPDRWENGILMVDGWVLKIEERVGFVLPENVKGVAADAYGGCYQLKNAVWNNAYLPPNVETLYINQISDATPWLYDLPITLKNIVICDTVAASDLRYCEGLFSNVSGVIIYVEALEADLRWDDNFPGWSNGNKVVYGDQWHWVNFYGESGNLISSQPCLNAQIVRLPVYEIVPDAHYTYEIVGWDLDGDGEVDSIPATSVVDIDAMPVIVAQERRYTVQFVDAANGTIYHELRLPYGAAIAAPADPEKKGYDFVSWVGLYDGITVVGDTVIYASWKHQGSGHQYADPVWVEATCTEPGYNKHTCTICGEFYGTDYTQPLGHSYEQTQVAASCTAQGYTLHSCKACGHSYCDNFTEKTAHDYGNWDPEKLPSCAENGIRHHKCKVCGYRESDEIPAQGHQFKETGCQNSSCNQAGKRQLECVDCAMCIEETLPAKSHNYQECYGNEAMKAFMDTQGVNVLWSHEEDGMYLFACEDCGDVMYGAAHNAGQAGTASAVCRHTHTSCNTVCQGGCTAPSLDAEVCDDCGEVVAMRVFGGTGHVYTSVVTEATCTEDGYTTCTCDFCGDSYVADRVDALGHDYVDGVCTRCGGQDVLLGDVNGDGKVNTGDARLLLRYLADLVDESKINLAAADFNGDGRINTRDARAILRFLAEK